LYFFDCGCMLRVVDAILNRQMAVPYVCTTLSQLKMPLLVELA